MDGRFQTFKFDAVAGELVQAQVIWDGPTTRIKVFLRHENRIMVNRNTDDNGSPATVPTIAQTSGQWSVAVLIDSGSTNYDVLAATTLQ